MNDPFREFIAEMPAELWDGIERGQPSPSYSPPSSNPRVYLRESIMGGAPPTTSSSSRNVDPRAHAEAMRDEEERSRMERIARRPRYPWDEP